MKLKEFRTICGDYGPQEWLQITLKDGRAGQLVSDVVPACDEGFLTLRIDRQDVTVALAEVFSVESFEDWDNRMARPTLSVVFNHLLGGRASFNGRGPEGLLKEAAKALWFDQQGKAMRCILGYLALRSIMDAGLITPEAATECTAPNDVQIQGRKALVTFSHKGGIIQATVDL